MYVAFCYRALNSRISDMEGIIEAMRNIAFEFWKKVVLGYRTTVIRAELKRRKSIADCRDRRIKRRKADLLLGQSQTDCQNDNHCITVENVSLTPATPNTMYKCDRSEMRQVFDLFDENKDGLISAEELQQYVKRLGFELSDQTVKEMVRSDDISSDNCVLDFEQFFSLYSSLCGGQGGNSTTRDKNCPNGTEEDDDEEGNLLKAFFVFDENKDGLISVLELQQVLLKLGLPEGRSLMSCQKMIEKVDADGNGKVDFFEFKAMMSSNTFSSCSS